MIVIGAILFALYKPTPDNGDKIIIGPIIIWGTMDSHIFDRLLEDMRKNDSRFNNVKYIEKSKNTYDDDILEALAEQKAPDLILLSNEDFIINRNKIYAIPNENLSKRDYTNTYADAFSIYIQKEGIMGIPFAIDPMIMYYNKNMFDTNRVVVPPTTWEEFEEPNGITDKLRTLDQQGNILKSGISFGEFLNVSNYKEILYTLFLERNNKVILEGQDKYKSDSHNFMKTSDVIKFYTQFSNQSNRISYSWNRSMNNSEKEFLSENLATYFGFSSEIRKIRMKNPNLNFDVAEIPIFKDNKIRRVYAKTWVFSIPKSSKNKAGALEVAFELSSKKIQEKLVNQISLPPVRKEMLNQRKEDIYMDLFYKEAIYSNSILDPDPEKTKVIMGEYISNVNTGLKTPLEATKILSSELDVILENYKF